MNVKKEGEKFVITDFSEFEAYKIAAKLEKDGTGFYTYLADKTKDGEAKKLYEFLSEEERKHLQFFQDHLDKLKQEKEDTTDYADNNLINLMDTGVFPSYRMLSIMSEDAYDEKEALQFALDVEVKSVNYYRACLEHITSGDTQKALMDIIEEETRHKELLENAQKTLSK